MGKTREIGGWGDDFSARVAKRLQRSAMIRSRSHQTVAAKASKTQKGIPGGNLPFMPRIMFAIPPLLPIFFIMRCICLCCFSRRLTS